jgi:hypothetical protein
MEVAAMVKILFFVTMLAAVLFLTACGPDYDFAKKECAARGSKVKNYYHDLTGGSFQCEDLFQYQ